MNNRIDTSDIEGFLEKSRNLLSDGKYDFVPRRKNLQSLANYGLTVIDAKEEIYNLGAGDYHKGPKRDFENYRSGDIWEFKKEIKGKKFYIKLKISQDSGEEVLKCLGFHEDEFA